MIICEPNLCIFLYMKGHPDAQVRLMRQGNQLDGLDYFLVSTLLAPEYT